MVTLLKRLAVPQTRGLRSSLCRSWWFNSFRGRWYPFLGATIPLRLEITAPPRLEAGDLLLFLEADDPPLAEVGGSPLSRSHLSSLCTLLAGDKDFQLCAVSVAAQNLHTIPLWNNMQVLYCVKATHSFWNPQLQLSEYRPGSHPHVEAGVVAPVDAGNPTRVEAGEELFSCRCQWFYEWKGVWSQSCTGRWKVLFVWRPVILILV